MPISAKMITNVDPGGVFNNNPAYRRMGYLCILLPNAKLLVTGWRTESWICDPDASGNYDSSPSQWRQIDPPLHRHQYACVTLDPGGDKVYFWGSEYDDDGNIGGGGFRAAIDWVDVFDVGSETWTNLSGVPDYWPNGPGDGLGFYGHRCLAMADDGTILGPYGRALPAGADPVTGYIEAVPWPGWYSKETGLVLLPDGRFFIVARAQADAVQGGANLPGSGHYEVIEVPYSASMIADGSFDSGGTWNRTAGDVGQQLIASNGGSSYALTSYTDGIDWGAISGGNGAPLNSGSILEGWPGTAGEHGGNLYHPGIDKVVVAGGSGVIWTWDPTTEAGALAANLDLDWRDTAVITGENNKTPPTRVAGGKIGVLTATHNGQIGGRWTYIGPPASPPVIALDQDWLSTIEIDTTGFTSSYQRFHNDVTTAPSRYGIIYVKTASGALRSFSSRQMISSWGGSGVATLTCPGMPEDLSISRAVDEFLSDYNTKPIGDPVLSTGDSVYNLMPGGKFLDSSTCIIPNGDVIFAGHIQTGPTSFIGGVLAFWSWDTVASTASIWFEPFESTSWSPSLMFASGGGGTQAEGMTASAWGTLMVLLPNADSDLLVHCGDSSHFIVKLTAAEKTPITAWKPTITTFTDRVRPGQDYTLTGTQLNGRHVGAAQNDDASLECNVPIARFTRQSDGHTFYGWTRERTYLGIGANRSSSITVRIPNDFISVKSGIYDLQVVTAGVASDPFQVTVDAAPGEAASAARMTMFL